MQLTNRVTGFIADRIGQRDEAAHMIVIADHNDGASGFLHRFELRVDLRRLLPALFQVAMRTQPIRLAINDARSSLSLNRFKPVGWRNGHASTLRLFDDGASERVVAIEFQRTGSRQEFDVVVSVHWEDVDDFRFALGQGSRLVHCDRFQHRRHLDEHTAFDQNAVAGRRRKRSHDADRR